MAGADGTPQIFQSKWTRCELDVGNIMCYAMEIKGLLSPLKIKIQEVQGSSNGLEMYFSTRNMQPDNDNHEMRVFGKTFICIASE